MLFAEMRINQIEQWEQENPDNIDEVPVQADHLHRRIPVRAETIAPRHYDQSGEQADAYNHVQRVHARHGEVEKKQNLSLVKVLRVGISKSRARDVMIDPSPSSVQAERRAPPAPW